MVVIVDDDEIFREGLAEHLRDDGHEVLTFAASADLPPLHELRGVSLLVTDYLLPGEDGLSLAARFHAVHPDIPIAVVTAFATEHLEGEIATAGFAQLVRKPLDYDTFRRLVATFTH